MDCPICKGTGLLPMAGDDEFTDEHYCDCANCDGTGYIRGRTIKHKIITKGFPVVDLCYAHMESENIIALAVQTKTRHCECSSWGWSDDNTPLMYLVGTKGSLHGRRNKKYDDITEIYFPELEGWDIWSITPGNYVLYCCLIKTQG